MVAANFGEFAMSDNFYRAFEDRHRGSRELIHGKYLPDMLQCSGFGSGWRFLWRMVYE
jgi:hypothetical protein